MIERSMRGDVAWLRLAHGKASAMDLEFLRALDAAFEHEMHSCARAVVLTGTGSIFSAGVDLKRLLAGGAAYIADFLPALDAAFLRLFALEKPIVAALNGHALAGGCVLASACDVRLIARGNATYGAPELTVGVPFPPSALEIVRSACPPQILSQVLLQGRVFKAEECAVLGLVEEQVEPAQLADRAQELAESMARAPQRSFASTKRSLRAPALAAIRAGTERERATILADWSSAEVLAAVDAYVARTLRR